jgi:general transcription factor 3C polypeptide 5 (transcription factor C subunit 1)
MMRDMIGMMLAGEAPDTSAYKTISKLPDLVDKSTYPEFYFDRDVHGDKVAQLSMEVRNFVKTDRASRVRSKFQVDGEVVGDGAQGGAEEDDQAGDGIADDVDEEEDDEEMEGDLDDFGGEAGAEV